MHQIISVLDASDHLCARSNFDMDCSSLLSNDSYASAIKQHCVDCKLCVLEIAPGRCLEGLEE